jgi:protein-L-isoaspartate(D-aspartate) O-methyltransferase
MEGLSADPHRIRPLIERVERLGVTDPRVLGAMVQVSRGAFVDNPALEPLTFADAVVPIACGQVMLRPATTGHLIQAMGLPEDPALRVLLIGFGSGYMTALLAALCPQVDAVERFAGLVEAGEARLTRLGIHNVSLRHGDGLRGWPGRGPFDRIVLAGSVLQVPHLLTNQLAIRGRLTAPVMTSAGGAIVTLDQDGKVERYPFFPPIPGLISGMAQAL